LAHLGELVAGVKPCAGIGKTEARSIWSEARTTIRSVVSESAHSEAPTVRSKAAPGWTFAAFRAWREREHPRSSYQIAPAVWRPERLAQIECETDAERRALKNWEPRFTGVAYAERAVYLIQVVSEVSAEHIGRLLYLVDLRRRDPDSREHQDKRVHVVMPARNAVRSLIVFARRRKVSMIVPRAGTKPAGWPTGMAAAWRSRRSTIARAMLRRWRAFAYRAIEHAGLGRQSRLVET
jgi:hypothetical protein